MTGRHRARPAGRHRARTEPRARIRTATVVAITTAVIVLAPSTPTVDYTWRPAQATTSTPITAQ